MILSIITKNSYEKVGERFAEVLDSSLQVPYRAIILIDDSDDDKTATFVKRFAESRGKELIVMRSRNYGYFKPTRATARQTAIDIFLENFSEEWLFFLDDDFILNPGWWEEASRYTQEPRVGLVWGVDYTPNWVDRLRWLETRGVTQRDYAVANFKIRGGLHDTLLRREAIEGIKLPPWLHVYEDAYVKKYIECKGWQWRIVEVGGIHLRASAEGYTKRDEDIMIKATVQYKFEEISTSQILKALFGLPAYMFYAYKAYKKPTRGLQIWRSRISYRFKVWLGQLTHRGDPCAKLLNR